MRIHVGKWYDQAFVTAFTHNDEVMLRVSVDIFKDRPVAYTPDGEWPTVGACRKSGKTDESIIVSGPGHNGFL